MNSNQRKHYERLAALGCILCRSLGYKDTPTEIHHIRRHGMKRDNAPVIGLCPEHHRGNTGVHGLGRKAFAKRYGVTEEDLLEVTTKLLEAYDEIQSCRKRKTDCS
jgi:hypothetical protein